MAANKPVVQRDRQRDGGATRARLLLGAVSATLFVSMGGAQSAAGQAVTAVAATATSADCHWQVSGTWKTQTLPYHPVFKLTQDGAKISGTETFSPADAASAGFPNPTATVAGTLVGDEIDIVATFHGVLKIGRRAAGTLQAEYKGTITTGRVAGTGQDITTPNTGTVPWNGTGPAECVTRYLWTASGKAVKPSGVRVLLPELPNGGETSYRQYTGHATSSGEDLVDLRNASSISVVIRKRA